MPELPEVETIAQRLRLGAGFPPLPTRRVVGVTLRWPRHVAEPSPDSFRRRMRGRVFQDVGRRGKYLLFPLDQGTLLIHLRMSGDLQMVAEGTPLGKHDHTILHLDAPWELRFNDPRKFGRAYLLDDPRSILDKLGPEPLAQDFTPQVLFTRLQTRRRMLKPLLLDQSFIAGLGNIYVDEALHVAQIHPLRSSHTLSEEQAHALWRGIREVLSSGLNHNGASIDAVYRGGEFQNHFRVYSRSGEPCPVCGTPIERIVVGQRGTHLCPTCQPEESP